MTILNSAKYKCNKNKIALISGEGSLPNYILQELKNNKIETFAFCPIGLKTDIPKNINKILFDLYDLENLIIELNKRGITYLAFAGKITRNNISSSPFFSKNLKSKFNHIIDLRETDDILLRKVGKFFENQGFKILPIKELVPNLLLKEGISTKRKPSIEDRNDIYKAIDFHKIMSKADMGQSLIVSNGLCLAVETIPGTDSMIEFVYNFKKKNNELNNLSNGIFFKSLKLNQDHKFDYPVIGEKTLINIKKSNLSGLALFENKLILLNKERLIKLADDLELFIFTVR